MIPSAITKAERAASMAQRPACIWLTGIPAAGKSTIARELERRLQAAGRHSYVLDGDLLRAGLNRDLGFSQVARAENVRRNAEVARLMVDAGLIVICAFISPYRDQRRFARSLFDPGEFLEVFLDAPVPVCEARDPKGNYARARRGEIPNFTGIDGSYEAPDAAELHLDTEHLSIDECVVRILQVI
ncbi:MAG TPA: adenylyl-sulfate kinase [Burkholderiaceae bacterium]|nr:adenylyl-sulfate kinase [Burkholderiaceae bacterium]